MTSSDPRQNNSCLKTSIIIITEIDNFSIMMNKFSYIETKRICNLCYNNNVIWWTQKCCIRLHIMYKTILIEILIKHASSVNIA